MIEDVDMYGVPYADGDPLLGLVISIVLITLFYVILWVIEQIKQINNKI